MPKLAEYQLLALDNLEDFVGEPILMSRLQLAAACPANGDKQTASSKDERHPDHCWHHIIFQMMGLLILIYLKKLMLIQV